MDYRQRPANLMAKREDFSTRSLPFSLAKFERHRQIGDRIAASLIIALEFFPRYFRSVEFCFWIVLFTKSQQGGFAARYRLSPANGAGLLAFKEK